MIDSTPHYRGRFAPSPTGPLHLGSLATAMASYLDAKIHQGVWLVRIEDIDPQRCHAQWTAEILSTLATHGLHSDEPVLIQSERVALYQQSLEQLTKAGLTYPCGCTRKDIELANADRAFGENRVYPGTCSKGMPAGKQARAIRFRCPQEAMTWEDWHAGRMSENLQQTSGDFVLLRGDGYWAYHLAVVVDDAASEVTHIVRGEDLIDTTARQVALYKALGKPVPRYWHLPVILAADGQKLSKQTGASALDLTQPVANLNTVWQHFGMEAIQAESCTQWLQKALPFWQGYRAQTHY